MIYSTDKMEVRLQMATIFSLVVYMTNSASQLAIERIQVAALVRFLP